MPGSRSESRRTRIWASRWSGWSAPAAPLTVPAGPSGGLALSAVVRNCTENSAERCPGSDETADRAAVKPCEADQLVRAGGELAIYGRQPWVNVPSLLPTHGPARSEGKHQVFSCAGGGLIG